MSRSIIAEIEANSLAEELGLEVGDKILKINNQEPQDLIDFQILWANEEVELLVEEYKSGQQLLFHIEKDFDEGLGVVFEEAVFDKMRTCQNRCKFCFIEQMAPAMRASLYGKDDDYRLSFLQGNFITLTNLVNTDLERIKKLNLSPLYVSVHTTDPGLRKDLLGNPKAGKILEQLAELTEAGIEIHTQVVLCKGVNDGEYLKKTIQEISLLWPGVRSLAIVPVGVTKYRKNIDQFPEFDQRDLKHLIRDISLQQQWFKKKFNYSFVFLSDEFYLKGKSDLPTADIYEDFPQIENGVGLSRIFLDDFESLKNTFPKEVIPAKYYIVTSVLGEIILKPIVEYLNNKIKGLTLDLKVIENNFFGKRVTVTGLLTGTDLLQGLKNLEKNATVIIPDVMIKKNDNLFLDGFTPDEIEKKLEIKLSIVSTTASGLVGKIINSEVRSD